MIKSIITRILFVSLIVFSLIACSGGELFEGVQFPMPRPSLPPGGGDTPPSPALKTGVFLDSAVEGLNYDTATHSGVTDAAGIFQYREGETITFYLGATVLGRTTAKERITPIDLVAVASDETDPKVTNICRLLQSLDKDGIPENGIQIPQQIKDVLKNHPVDLNLSTLEFETSSPIKNLFGELNGLSVFTDQGERVLRTTDQARMHFRETIRAFGGGNNDPACGACTANFVFLFLAVIDQSGNPLTDVNITVKIKRTQEVLNINQPSLPSFFTGGRYVVFDDGWVGRITTDAAGETLTVTGNSQGRNFTVEIVVRTNPCLCHFEKVSGPGSVTL